MNNGAISARRRGHTALRRSAHHAPSAGFWALTLGSVGVVYGDIGTSPLYALRESVTAAVGAGNPASEPVVLGILSLIIWALLIVVTAKYVLILLRADNNGEGGTLALMALASRERGPPRIGRDPARHHQRRAVLRRRDDHAGALRPVRRRGPEDRNAGIRALRGADHGRDPHRSVRGSVARHRQGRGLFRSDHAGLVRRAGGRRHLAYRPKSERAGGVQSAATGSTS